MILVLKNDQKVSNNMILMSKYKGQHGGKKDQKIRAGVSPPPFGQWPKEFFSGEVFPYIDSTYSLSIEQIAYR